MLIDSALAPGSELLEREHEFSGFSAVLFGQDLTGVRPERLDGVAVLRPQIAAALPEPSPSEELKGCLWLFSVRLAAREAFL